MENTALVNVDEKYQMKDEISHVLDRSGTWIGSKSTDVVPYPLFVPSKNKIQLLQNIGVNNGLMKLIDEVLSNSIDEHRRKDSLYKVTEIDVTVNADGSVRIKDNGGIPVQIHRGTGLLVPEMLFGYLRTSSNYDDTQDREVVGTNGLGAKLTNIFSKNFTVQTCDGKNSVCVEWSNNMRDINKDLEKYPNGGFFIKPEDNKDGKNHGTIVKFDIELERFELESMPVSTIRVVQKRCIDAAAANPGLLINFKSDVAEGKLDSTWQFDNFFDYVKLYLDEEQVKHIMPFTNKKDHIVIVPDYLGFNFGFVNGAICSEGTHIKKLQSQLVEKMLEICGKNDMELITEKDILNRLTIFVSTTVINPEYDSQSKTKLSKKLDKFSLTFTKEFLDGLATSELMQSLKDYYQIKYAEEKKKETRKLNALIKNTKSKKLIACASNSPSNELWLFEGDSASNGFRNARNLIQSAYLLRGKITNTFNLKKTQILENQELREVIAALGILFEEPQKNVKNCLYSKIIIASDMDHDGNHICGLLLAFFAKHFPELFKARRVYRALSPIVIASKGKIKNYYYTLDEYHADEKNLKGYEVIFNKGLGGLADADYRQMLRNQKLIQFTFDDAQDMEAINIWFDKSTEQRKMIILEDSGALID